MLLSEVAHRWTHPEKPAKPDYRNIDNYSK